MTSGKVMVVDGCNESLQHSDGRYDDNHSQNGIPLQKSFENVNVGIPQLRGESGIVFTEDIFESSKSKLF